LLEEFVAVVAQPAPERGREVRIHHVGAHFLHQAP
jgi:hypothetical protein